MGLMSGSLMGELEIQVIGACSARVARIKLEKARSLLVRWGFLGKQESNI